MCAVIGAILQKPTQKDYDTLRRVFIESQVRGKHATGLSYVAQGVVHTIKHPLPADAFPFDFPSYLNEDGNLYLIGHCRYSTSDLEFNQPIGNEQFAIVHNGVISQELPENWEKLYRYKCTTRNDTELLFRTIEEFGPTSFMWSMWADASIAMIMLRADKVILPVRNNKRPLWVGNTRNSNGQNLWITSTHNIAMRSSLPNAIRCDSKTGILGDIQP